MRRKKNAYSRAQMRARFRKPKARRSGSLVWSVSIVVVAVLGVGAVALARGDRDAAADVPPRVETGDGQGDHWHAYLGVDVCGEWLPNAPEFHTASDSANVQAGVHSHGDGNIHIHPFNRSEAGNNATVGKFIEYGGWSLSESMMRLWDETEHADGDTCDAGELAGEEAVLQWTVNGEVQSGNPADYKPADGDVIAIYLLPEGAELPEPPGAGAAISNPIDESGAPPGELPVTPEPAPEPAAPGS